MGKKLYISDSNIHKYDDAFKQRLKKCTFDISAEENTLYELQRFYNDFCIIKAKHHNHTKPHEKASFEKTFFINRIKGLDLPVLFALAKDLKKVQQNEADPELQELFAKIRFEKKGIFSLFNFNRGNTRYWQGIFHSLKQEIITKLAEEPKYKKNKIAIAPHVYQQAYSILGQRTGKILTSTTLPTKSIILFKRLFIQDKEASIEQHPQKTLSKGPLPF